MEHPTASSTTLARDLTLRRLYVPIVGVNLLFIAMTAFTDLRLDAAADWVGQFDLKREGNIATWYSSALFALVGLAAWRVRDTLIGDERPHWGRWFWSLVAVGFVVLAIDETARLHEKAGTLYTEIFGEIESYTDREGVFAWVIVYLPIIMAFAAAMLYAGWKWLRVWPSSRWLALAGLACWVGVVIAEVIEGVRFSLLLERSVQGMIEEGLELTGATLFFMSFVEFTRFDRRRVLKFKGPADTPTQAAA